MSNLLLLLVSLIFIVISSNLFCNALEHLGERLGVSEGVTGSILAAVGTALPETIIPILAILSSHLGIANKEIGVGAILGAPLMLSTLSVFVMAISVIPKRGLNGVIKPEHIGIRRDLGFFFVGYGLAFVAVFLQNFRFSHLINVLIAITLIVSYLIYLMLTIRASSDLTLEGHGTHADSKLAIQSLGFRYGKVSISLQLSVALMMLIYFAGIFIDGVNNVATLYNLSPFVLSLIIIPIATEMPEKVNSIIWLRHGRDTLAIGNITGAMVFQGTLLPVIGILFTDWSLNSRLTLLSIFFTLCATMWVFLHVIRKDLRVWHFLVNGVLYVVNLGICAYFFYR